MILWKRRNRVPWGTPSEAVWKFRVRPGRRTKAARGLQTASKTKIGEEK